jgi:phosphopantetheinyl transferase
MFAVNHIDLRASGTRRMIETYATAADHNAVARYLSPRRRMQGLGARALARKMLELWSDRPGSAWTLGKDAQGRPSAHGDGSLPPVELSLSHSASLVACAVTDQAAIGVDVEYAGRDRPFAAIAAAAFGAGEAALVAAKGAVGFYRIWTLREALAKALGTGFPMIVDGRDYFAGTPDSCDWHAEIGGRSVAFSAARIAQDYSLAVALLPRAQVKEHSAAFSEALLRQPH